MQPGSPSRTALGAARHRAAHQVLEQGRVFTDPLALRILGAEAEATVRAAEGDPSRRGLRLFIAVRSRFAEDALAAAFAAGTRQLVILGAGLDTFACRNPHGPDLRIFEVDHPATQAWKRQRLAEAGLAVPPNLTFVPVDFEREALPGALAAAGFDAGGPSFFSWLGVVPYLTEEAVFATLGFLAALSGRIQVVFDYGNPARPGSGPDAYETARDELARRVEAIGESLQCHFETGDLHARLGALGFTVLDDLGPVLLRERFFPNRGGVLGDRGGHILLAASEGQKG